MATPNRLSDAVLLGALSRKCKTWLSDDDGTRGGGRLVARVSGMNVLFYFRYSIDGKMAFIPIGPYSQRACEGRFTLTQARAKVSQYAAVHRTPRTDEATGALHLKLRELPACSAVPTPAPEPKQNDPAKSLAALCNFYGDELKRLGKKSAASAAYDIKRHIASNPACQLDASEVTAEMIAEILRPIYAHSKRNAGKLRAYMGAAYEKARLSPTAMDASPGWLAFQVRTNPVRSTAALGKSGKRDRSLSPRELGWFMLYLELPANALQTSCRALRVNMFLGCQRARQLLRCVQADFDAYARTLLLLDGKGRREVARKHLLPLVDAAFDEIYSLRLVAKAMDSPFIFPGRTPGAPLNHHSLSKLVTNISSELIQRGLIPEGRSFTYLDLRRTAESRMAEIKIPSDVRARMLSHGLTGVQVENYDRADYLDLLREALVIWHSFLRRCADEHRESFTSAFKGGSSDVRTPLAVRAKIAGGL